MSNRTYLLVFNDSAGTRDEIKEILDAQADIPYWYTCLPHAFLFASDKNPKELTDRIHTSTGGKGRFMIVDVTNAPRNGWMPLKAWKLMRNPEFRGEEHE